MSNKPCPLPHAGAVDDGSPTPAQPSPQPVRPEPVPDTADAADACAFCYQTPCIGPEHPAFATLHSQDPLEIAKRHKEATAVMLKMMKFGNPY